MDADRWQKYIEKFRGDIQWYMMESETIIPGICFKLGNESNQLV